LLLLLLMLLPLLPLLRGSRLNRRFQRRTTSKSSSVLKLASVHERYQRDDDSYDDDVKDDGRER